MSNGTHIDRRLDQTQHEYAAADLEIIEEARRYGEHVFELFRPFVGRRVLEVGAGIGTMSKKLLRSSDLVIGIEPNPNCLARLRAAMSGEPKFTMLSCHLEECDLHNLQQQRLDTVYCVNVLEHIKDDVAALKLFSDAIVSGGHVLIYVPAIQAAYGPLDAELGHHRRYSKRTLSAAFSAAGLELIRLQYANAIGLIGWMYNSHVTKTRHHSVEQVKLFERFVAPWALPLEKLIPPPLGSSLVAVGRKR